MSMKFAVKFTSERGETREVIVALTEEEEADCAHQAAIHGCPRWELLERTYAANRAALGLPSEFIWRFPTVERINLQ